MTRPLRPCAAPGCPRPAVHGSSRCQEHAQRQQRSDPRPNRHARGYGAEWERLRRAFLARHPWCMWPGCGERATDVDHVVPRSRGGTDEWGNLQALCHRHHSRKTATADRMG